jgi:hypothetical protein
MPDEIYRPISDQDNESETPSPQTELPIASWSDFRKELEEAHEVSRDALTPEEAAESIRSRRDEVATPENARERPIVVHKSRDTGPQSLREATDNLAYSRGLALRNELLETGHSEEEVQRRGVEMLEAAQRGDPRDPPPIKVEVEDKPGEEGKALSVEEASRRLTEWRAQQAAAREQELAEFDAERQQRLQEEYEAQQQPEPQPESEAAQEPDPVQQEWAQVQQERQTTEAIKNLSLHEVASLNGLTQLTRQVQQSFPELANVRSEQDLHNLHAQLQAQNPARAQALADADRVMRQRQVALANLTNQRKAHEAQQAQITAQQRAQAAAQHDAQFEARAAKIVPNWEQARPAMQAAAKKALVDAGISEAEQHRLWHQGTPIDIRSSAAQELILKAAMWDSAQAKAWQIRQTPLPQVIKPGMGRSHGQDGAERVADLRARLRTSKGNESLRLATELTKAKRALNN